MIAGVINGLLVAYTKIPPFIATLGMMVSARGAAQWWSRGNPVSFPTDDFAWIGSGLMPIYWFVILAFLFHFLMKYTIYTDGACSGNPGPGGWGAVIFDNENKQKNISGREENTTNNRMELSRKNMSIIYQESLL